MSEQITNFLLHTWGGGWILGFGVGLGVAEFFIKCRRSEPVGRE